VYLSKEKVEIGFRKIFEIPTPLVRPADRLSVEHLGKIPEKLMHRRCDPEFEKLAKLFHDAVLGMIFLPDDLHVLMHVMVVIYN
jgi:hypothetical protein